MDLFQNWRHRTRTHFVWLCFGIPSRLRTWQPWTRSSNPNFTDRKLFVDSPKTWRFKALIGIFACSNKSVISVRHISEISCECISFPPYFDCGRTVSKFCARLLLAIFLVIFYLAVARSNSVNNMGLVQVSFFPSEC